MNSFKPDIQIAQEADIKPIDEIAGKLKVDKHTIEHYGRYKAKLPLDLIDDDKVGTSKLVLVTAITPTPPGEGKTTTSIGLSEGLNRLGKRSIVVLREPSLGPVFGRKGGAAGGGYAQVIPMEDINLHFTGDFAAIEKANNLLAAMIDNSIQNLKSKVGIDPRTVRWKRVMDMNDRALRNVVTGLGGKAGGFLREAGFEITAASEVMAILCMATSLSDLKERLANIYIGDNFDGEPIFARDIHAHGAMTALLKEAIKPNLVQTLEGNPALIHGGPFANIAQGTNSIIATKMGLSLGDYVVTEAGFGADLGMEKFLDIKCRASGLSPAVVVMVVTVRALKYHAGVPMDELTKPNPAAVKNGLSNLEKHLENVALFKIEPLVAVNVFHSDTNEEIDIIKEACEDLGVTTEICDGWRKGGEGTLHFAEKVLELAEKAHKKFLPIYDSDDSIEEKIRKVGQKIYGAGKIVYQGKAVQDLHKISELGFDHLPVCIAKTQNSLSDDSKLLGRPEGFKITVREIEIAAGAGFVIPLMGQIMRMPGLPAHPAAENIDIDDEGVISGLS